MSLRQFPNHCDPYQWSGTAGMVLTGQCRLAGFNVVLDSSAGSALVHVTELSAAGQTLYKGTAAAGQFIQLNTPLRANGLYASAASSTLVHVVVYAVDDRKG